MKINFHDVGELVDAYIDNNHTIIVVATNITFIYFPYNKMTFSLRLNQSEWISINDLYLCAVLLGFSFNSMTEVFLSIEDKYGMSIEEFSHGLLRFD